MKSSCANSRSVAYLEMFFGTFPNMGYLVIYSGLGLFEKIFWHGTEEIIIIIIMHFYSTSSNTQGINRWYFKIHSQKIQVIPEISQRERVRRAMEEKLTERDVS